MRVTYRGLVLKQALDMVTGKLERQGWFVLHRGSGRTVLMIDAPADRARHITSELEKRRDWQNTQEWEDDIGLAVFAAQYLGEVELPTYDDETADDDVFWGEDMDTIVPYGDEPKGRP